MRQPRFVLAPLALAAWLAAGLSGSAHAQPNATNPVAITIAAQPLGPALNELARQAGLQLLFPPALVAGKTAAAVSGTLTPNQALDQMLAGSGLVAIREGTAILVKARPPSGETTTLSTVTVTAEADRNGTTEGTGSYTPNTSHAATRMPLSLRETPQSVTVVTAQQLEDRGITSLSQAMETVPGIRVLTDMTRPWFYSRGLFLSNIQVDGNPMLPGGQALSGIQTDSMIAYDRIEVLRGANGLLTGPGDPSGTVTLVRKRPTHAFQAHAQVGVGSWQNRQVDVDVSGPLNAAGTVRGRVAVGASDSDYFIEQTGRDGKALLAVVEADLTPRTTARLGYQFEQYNFQGTNGGSTVPLWYSNGLAYDAPRTMGMMPRNTTQNDRSRKFYAELEHVFDNDWRFKGVLENAHRDRIHQPVATAWIDSYPEPSGFGTQINQFVSNPIADRQWAYNFDFQGPVKLWGREHRLMLGASGWDRQRDTRDWVIDWSQTPSDSFFAGLPTRLAPSYNPAPAPYYLTGFPRSVERTDQHGIFAAARWNLANSVKLITGVRVTNWKASTDLYNGRTGALTQANASAQSVRRVITPYVGAVWDFHPNLSAYASYADIFQPQNFYDRNDRLLEPVVGKNYEAGIKGEFFNKQLNASLAAFRVVQDNLAELDPGYPQNYLTPGGNTPYRSVGKGVNTKGLELEVSGTPQPGWNVSGGYTYAVSNDAKGQPYDRNQPKHLLRLFTTYRLQGNWSGLTLGVGATWNSAISQVQQRPTGLYSPYGYPVTADYENRQGSVWLVNAMVRYQATPKLSLLLNIDNLLDKKYYNTLSPWTPSAYWGRPRSLRLTMRYQY